MLKLIWNTLNVKERIALIIIVVLLLIVSFQAIKIAKDHYQRVKRIEISLEKFQKAQDKNTQATDKSINNGKSGTNKAVKKKQNIDKKLQDEKTNIDNSDYPDIKLDSVLTRYED